MYVQKTIAHNLNSSRKEAPYRNGGGCSIVHRNVAEDQALRVASSSEANSEISSSLHSTVVVIPST